MLGHLGEDSKKQGFALDWMLAGVEGGSGMGILARFSRKVVGMKPGYPRVGIEAALTPGRGSLGGPGSGHLLSQDVRWACVLSFRSSGLARVGLCG